MLEDGWTIEATAERFQVDAKTVRKWRDRFLAEGADGSPDRSSRGRIVHRTGPASTATPGVAPARKRRWGAAHIASRGRPGAVDGAADPARRGAAASTAVTGPPPTRSALSARAAGELIHVDVKKMAAIPAGGGWRPTAAATTPAGNRGAGYRYIHTAIDDRTRLVYSEILDDEQAMTAAGSGPGRAWFTTTASRANE